MCLMLSKYDRKVYCNHTLIYEVVFLDKYIYVDKANSVTKQKDSEEGDYVKLIILPCSTLQKIIGLSKS